jgi:cell division protein FtsN
MYCPKCTVDIDYKSSGTCPYCSTSLVEIPAQTHAASTEEIMNFQVRPSSGSEDQSQSGELLDKAFEEIHIGNQRARPRGSKSLAITALLGAVLLLSFIGTGIYYLNHTPAHETALQTPAKILTLPPSEAPAPTLKNAPQLELQNENGTSHTAQDGSLAKQDLAAYQIQVQDAARPASDSPEIKNLQDIPTKEPQAADAAVSQKNMPSSREAPPITATSQALSAEMHARPPKVNNDSTDTSAIKQGSTAASSINAPVHSEAGSHVLLCGSFQSREKALKQASKIKAKGYMPFVEKADLGTKGLWYRIKIAGFISKDAAEKARDELNKSLHLAAIVSKHK